MSESWLVGSGLDVEFKTDYVFSESSNVRFWLPKGEIRDIIFLTEGFGPKAGPVIWEHQVRLNNSWRNWFTCLQTIKQPCPLCVYADKYNTGRRYMAAFFTVIDLCEFEDKRGIKHINEKKLLCVKKDTSEILKRKCLARVEAGQGLRGAMYTVFRKSSDKSCAVGDDFDFKKMVDLSTLPDATELDYEKLLAPNPESVKRAAEILMATSFGTGTGYEVPFGD